MATNYMFEYLARYTGERYWPVIPHQMAVTLFKYTCRGHKRCGPVFPVFPVYIDCWKMLHNTGVSFVESSHSILHDILSGPEALVTLRLDNGFWTPSTRMDNESIDGKLRPSSLGTLEPGGSHGVKTDLNWLLSMFAFSRGSEWRVPFNFRGEIPKASCLWDLI